jgi:diguanylate cyclase (GGDEF)-like protein
MFRGRVHGGSESERGSAACGLTAALVWPAAAVAVGAVAGVAIVMVSCVLTALATLLLMPYWRRTREGLAEATPDDAALESVLLGDPRQLAGRVAVHLARAAGVSRAHVLLFESGELHVAGSTGGVVGRPWLTCAGAHSLTASAQLTLNDRAVDPGALAADGVRSFLALPLRAEGELVGVACLAEQPGQHLSARLLAEASRAAGMAALALAATRLYRTQSDLARQLRQRSVVVEALLQLGNDLRASTGLEAVLARVGQALLDDLGYNEAAIYLTDEANDALVARCCLGGSDELNAVYLAQPIPRRVMDGFMRDEFRIGNSFFRSQARAPNTLEEDRYMPSSTLGPRGPNEWQNGDTLLAPMLTRDSRLLGIIDAYDPRDRCAPTPDSVRILELFANLAAVAIENALQYEALESQGQHLAREIQAHENLLAVSESMLTTLDQQVVFNAIDDQLRLLIDYDTLCIDRIDWPTRTMRPIYVRDETYGDAILDMAVAVGEGLCGWVAEHDEAILVNDVLTDARGAHIPGTVDGEPQASIVVPLTVQARVLGVLTIDRLGGKYFSEEDFDLVKVFASQAAIAIQNADLYEEIQLRAITDSLTGLYNHGHFEETLAHEITRSERYDEPFSLIMLDLDNFKRVNDRFGHPIGDRVLRRVADALAECSREADYVARYGGEEFAILLPGTRREDACRLAERIRQDMRLIAVGPGGSYHVAASLGVADYPACATDADGLVAAADAALLWAKRHGRDRVDYYGALAPAS